MIEIYKEKIALLQKQLELALIALGAECYCTDGGDSNGVIACEPCMAIKAIREMNSV